MRTVLVVALALVSLACGKVIDPVENTAYGYLTKIGIPEAERIRKYEEQASRIVGGSPASIGQYPYQVGLLIDINGMTGNAICGGSVLTATRVITAAHCWYDGQNQAWRFNVIYGSNTLFSGGIRQFSTNVAVHPQWLPQMVRNDIAVAYMETSVTFSATIAPVSLPTGSELTESFAGTIATASGFGLTADGAGISQNQVLSHVDLEVITNSICSWTFPFIVQPSNICTSGAGGRSTCSGDSGGPLVVVRGNRSIQIGVVSFGSALGCERGMPAAYARITSFIPFLQQHM